MFKSRVGISLAVLAGLLTVSGVANADVGYRSVVYTTPTSSDMSYYNGYRCKTVMGRQTSNGYIPKHTVCKYGNGKIAYYSRGAHRYAGCHMVKGKYRHGVYVPKHRVCYSNFRAAWYEGYYVCTKYVLSITPQHTDKQCSSWDWRPASFARTLYYR